MARCNVCGAELPDYYTSCPNCGGVSLSQSAPSPAVQAALQPHREVTSVGMWVVWLVVCSAIPVIGPIVLLCTAKDPSLKEFGKAYLVFYIVMSVIAIVILVSAIGWITKGLGC